MADLSSRILYGLNMFPTKNHILFIISIYLFYYYFYFIYIFILYIYIYILLLSNCPFILKAEPTDTSQVKCVFFNYIILLVVLKTDSR